MIYRIAIKKDGRAGVACMPTHWMEMNGALVIPMERVSHAVDLAEDLRRGANRSELSTEPLTYDWHVAWNE